MKYFFLSVMLFSLFNITASQTQETQTELPSEDDYAAWSAIYDKKIEGEGPLKYFRRWKEKRKWRSFSKEEMQKSKAFLAKRFDLF